MIHYGHSLVIAKPMNS